MSDVQRVALINYPRDGGEVLDSEGREFLEGWFRVVGLFRCCFGDRRQTMIKWWRQLLDRAKLLADTGPPEEGYTIDGQRLDDYSTVGSDSTQYLDLKAIGAAGAWARVSQMFQDVGAVNVDDDGLITHLYRAGAFPGSDGELRCVACKGDKSQHVGTHPSEA